jgi:NADH pyrophosphatase NudC (nudix superfamily)
MKICPECGGKLETAEVAGRQRQRCVSCDFVHWDNPVPVVAGIVEHEGDVILVRSKGWPEKWHGLVAGFLEKGESAEQGMLREVREELGLEAKIVGFVGIYPFFEKNQIIIAYHLTAAGTITLGDELAGMKRVPPGKLKPWAMGTGQAVRDWLESRGEISG